MVEQRSKARYGTTWKKTAKWVHSPEQQRSTRPGQQPQRESAEPVTCPAQNSPMDIRLKELGGGGDFHPFSLGKLTNRAAMGGLGTFTHLVLEVNQQNQTAMGSLSQKGANCKCQQERGIREEQRSLVTWARNNQRQQSEESTNGEDTSPAAPRQKRERQKPRSASTDPKR